MQPILLALTLGSVLVSQAAATVAFGSQGGNKVAWISGDDPCNPDNVVKISSSSQIPCDQNFSLHNGFSYQLRGCGTPTFALWNADGSFNAVANGRGQLIGCDEVADVHQEWEF